MGSTAFEALLRRDRWVVAASLSALCVLAWAYLIAGAGMGMSVADLASAALFPHTHAGSMSAMDMDMDMDRSMGEPLGLYGLLLAAMWWIMMIAMMTPSAAPMILLHARVARDAQAKGRDARGTLQQTGVFTAGYLLAWLGFSIAAAALQWGLEAAGLVSRMMTSMSAALSAAVLIAAGVYQWTPLKNVCLRGCRAPAQFLSRHWRPGRRGALRLGILHGAYCVGCCWALMALLFVGGIMNPVWIAALAVVVLVEKVAPAGVVLSRIGGGLLIVWGIVTLGV
jgi:predicted metal-binding membrane protein